MLKKNEKLVFPMEKKQKQEKVGGLKGQRGENR